MVRHNYLEALILVSVSVSVNSTRVVRSLAMVHMKRSIKAAEP